MSQSSYHSSGVALFRVLAYPLLYYILICLLSRYCLSIRPRYIGQTSFTVLCWCCTTKILMNNKLFPLQMSLWSWHIDIHLGVHVQSLDETANEIIKSHSGCCFNHLLIVEEPLQSLENLIRNVDLPCHPVAKV